MSTSEFRSATVAETVAFINARQKRQKDDREFEIQKMQLQRLNTYYIMKSFGSEISDPSELYNLPGDTISETEQVSQEELNSLFDKLTLD